MKSFYNNIIVIPLFKNKGLNVLGYFWSSNENFIKPNFISYDSS